MHRPTFLRLALIALAITLSSLGLRAQEYRSKASGNWNALTTWEQDNGSGWVDATVIPTNASGAITIRSPHTVTVTANVNLDDVTIEAGGTVTTTATGTTTWTIANGTYGVKVFGTFNANSSAGSFGCCGSVSVENGGVVNMNNGGAFFGPTTVQVGGTVNGNTAINLAGGAVVNNGTWTMAANQLMTNSAGGTFTNNGVLTLHGFTAGGTLINNANVTWNAGAISGAGPVVNTSGGNWTCASSNLKGISTTLTNQGTINWTGGVIVNGTGGSIQNASGGIFNIQFTSADQLQVPFTNQAGGVVNQNGSGTFNTISNGNGVFTNNGALNLVNGNWLTNQLFTNTGTVDIPAGRLLTFGSTTNLNSGTQFTGTGAITSGGTVTQNFPWTNTTHQFTLSGGSWTNSTGNPTVFGIGSAFNWTGGTIAGPAGWTLQSGFTATLSTTANKGISTTLTNQGTINWTGGVIVNGTGGSIQNASGGIFNIQFTSADQLQTPFTNQTGGVVNQNGSGTFNTISNGNGVFTNNGALNLVNGNWLSNQLFTNTGTIDIPAGRLLTFGSTTNLNSGTQFTGTGAITSGGTVTQNFPWTNTTHQFTLSGGSWTNSTGNPTVFGIGSAFNWTGGNIAGPAGWTLQSGFTATLSTTANKGISTTLTNQGTINWTGGVIVNGTGGSIQNASGGIFNIQFTSADQLQTPFTNQAGGVVNQNGSGTFNTISNGNGVFTNNGALNLVNGNWLTNQLFTNTGTIDIPAGRLLTFGSTTNLNSGTQFTGTGAITSGGTTNQFFPWANTTHSLYISGGTWNNLSGSPLTFDIGSAFTWAAGTLSGAAGCMIGAGFSASLTTTGTKTLNSTLTNNGTINWSGGAISGTSAIGNNAGSAMNISFSGTNLLGVNCYNYGTLTYTGSGTFNTSVIFQNVAPGILNVNSGQWHFNNLATLHTGSLNTAVGATAQFNFSTTIAGIVNNTGTLAGTIISFTGPTFTNNGSVTLTSLPFAGTAAQTLNGTGSISSLTLNNSNGLVLGGTQTITNTLALTSGRITLGNNDLIFSNNTLASLSGGNATNHIVTNGTGALHRQLPASGSNYLFPIGTGTSYLPVTVSLTSGPTERFAARVQNDVHSDYGTPGTPAGNVVVNEQVERTWVITEQTEGGNQATVQVQWNAADEGANFGRANCGLHSYNGTDWVALALGAAGGSNPYTRSASSVAVFREFTVADGESTLPFVCNNALVPGTACNDNDACTVSDVVTAGCACAGIFQDTDGDGTCNVNDGCPNDGNKTAPGVCGCGVADVAVTYYADTDGDGFGDPDGAQQAGYTCIVPPGFVANNTDGCPADATKQAPGACGCGIPDVHQNYYADTDGDGFGGGAAIPGFTCTIPPGTVTNNTDACPNDPFKQAPGACGCGNVEVDTDGDTTPDCIDACPNDPLKIAPLQCGCGNPETDSDSDGTADCVDACPNDPLKTSAGQCGCGNADTDTDGDGIADCVDNCPSVSGQQGSTCNDGNPATGSDVLNASCMCVGQLIDCQGIPGGAALPGTSCSASGLPGIWSAGCVCELAGLDVAVQNVGAPNDTIAGEQVITLTFDVYNNGNAPATVNWTERYYLESAAGTSRTLIAQASHNPGSPLAAGATLQRSVQVTMPSLLVVGDQGRFAIEIIPGTGLTELPNSAANNTGTQATPWVVRKQIKLQAPVLTLTEGGSLSMTVQRTGSISQAQVINIGIDESERFTFPSTVTILAGQAARSFTLVALENTLLEGPIPAVLTASATGFSSATRNLTILDNEAPALSFANVPATTGEGTSVTFQVSTNFAPASPLQVFLTSSDQARFPVPASVTIAASTTSANVTVNLPQDQLPELDITVNLTAGAANHTAATASLQLTDDDLPGLQFVLQTDTVSESGGAFAVQATLQRTAGSPAIAFTAVITPSFANTLLLPTSISLAANANQQTFTIGVIDNALVDGFRTVTINSAVQLAGCGCNAPVSTAANVSADLTVADNDGPTLTATVDPATLAEGLANAGTIRVQRNTSTTAALDVALISSDVTELILPATVSIPIGAAFVDVPASTVNDGTPDGSQQVYVQATADGFSPGITWCIVTDVNQPDLVVSAVTPSASPWPALVPFTWQATINNTGFANSIVGVPVRGVLSQNNLVDANDPVLFDYTINTPVPAGGSVQISGAAVAPDLPGTHQLLLQVNPSASVAELTYTNNTSAPVNVSIAPSYTATAQVAGTTFLRGTTIPVTGTAVRPDASPAANEPIEVYVLTNGLRREVLTTTDAAGAFTASFVPLANESGHYTIGASFPGMGQTTEQDAFDIHGVRINNGQYPQFTVLIGDTLTGTLSISNLSDAPLTNLTLTPLNVPAGSTFSFTTIASLAGGASTTIAYEVSGTVLTSGFNFQPGTLQVTADQGTIQGQDLYYYCMVPGGQISADLTSINTTVSQAAGQQLVQFRVFNTGGGNTGALNLSLPQAPWLQAMTPVNMGSLAPGDTALVILRFLADASVPFDLPISGTIAINGANSNSLVIPFSFTKVSVTVGALTVDAVNQFTFFDADEPHVEGATVEVRHAYSNALLAQGTTDANGLVTFTGIPEGEHRLVVSKPQHLPAEELVTINAGASVSQTVFLNYQAITFSWTVVPTQVQDQYDVQLNMEFETNIPIPVVTIDMPDTMPELFGNEVFAFNATLTNHGLIAAEQVTLNLPQDDPVYEFITNYSPSSISALQSIQVPVLMRRREEQLQSSMYLNVDALSEFLRMDGPTPDEPVCKEEVVIFWKYHCNNETGIWERNGALFSFLNRVCESTGGGLLSGVGFNPSVFGNGFPECPFCPDPISTAGYTHPDSVRLIYNKNCKECLADLGAALGGCLGGALLGEVGDALEDAIPGSSDALDVIGSGVHEEFGIELPDPLGDMRKNACVQSYGTQNPSRCAPPKGGPGGGCVTDGIAAGLGCSNLINTGGRATARLDLEQTVREQIPEALVELLLDLRLANEAYMHRDSIAMDYYSVLYTTDVVTDFRNLVASNIEELLPIGTVQRGIIQAALSGGSAVPAVIDEAIDRWNLSLEAFDAGVFSPNAQYPDIVDWTKIDVHQAVIDSAIGTAEDRGYSSVWELFAFSIGGIAEVLQAESNSVCASVTVQLSQTVTMTREAFTGTLDIFNGHPTDGIDSLSVDILITDPDGVPSNGLFQINTEQLTGLSDVTGTGQIPSQEHGIVQFLFIPEPGAAPTIPVPYSFGGSVTYRDPYNQEMTTIQLAGITLTVNPSPDLMLHYFMERNILGDDALTSPEVEPSIPAELAVMVENHGYGPAVNMKISSAQPEIVENESGLAINFELIGSNLQGQPAQLGVLDIPFGTIPPLQTRLGQWWFTSSLLGKFVSYEAEVVHANSFGNPELSLIQGVELHELTRSIREYGASGDAMNDFLVNDQFDVNDVPDIIYFSQGNRTAEVLPAASGSFNTPVAPPTFTNTLTLTATEPGWNYIKLDDPGDGGYDLVSVTRQDGQVIPLDNAWTTFVTLPVSQQPVYEDKFHFVDTLATTTATTYTVVWAPKNTDVPAVDTILGAPTAISALQVTQLTVVFDKAIDPATFTVADLTLTFQGGPDIMDNGATITQVDPFTFTVDLTALTVGNGQYTFIAQAAGVTDLFGISGVAGKQVSWTQFISVPAILSFQGLLGGTTDNAFTTIDLLFNLPIDEASLTAGDISITLNGIPQAGALTVIRLNNDSTLFQVAGLENVMTTDGTYELTVDMPNVLSTDGEPGMQTQSIALTLDNTGPTVAELTPSITGGLDAQHRTGVVIRWSEPVFGLNTGAVQFTRDGQNLPLNIAQLSQVDADEWQVTGFGLASYPDGDYSFTVSATTVTDAIGNAGTGSLNTAWTVDRSTPISVTAVGIDPDLGISNNDGLTSTTSFDALFNLNEDAAQVTIAQTSFGSEQVLATLQNMTAGGQSVPVTFPTGGNTGLKVTAIGANGGNAIGSKDLFIDQSPLSAAWQTANNQSLTTDLSSATIQFSADLLAASGIDDAITFQKDGLTQPTGTLTITPVNGSTYTISGLASIASGIGSYALSLNVSSLQKASSGIAGQGTATLSWNVVPVSTALLQARVFLEGPYTSGVMNDSLRHLSGFPLTEPFTAMGYVHAGSGGGETTTPAVLSVPGNDAIVDWVLVELRDPDDNSSVVASRSALLQRDGDVVAMDGLSPVNMTVGAGSYHVAVRHRNHLGTMTEDTVTFASGAVNVDFTLLSTDLFGSQPQKQVGARRALWAGDVSFDNAVQYTGSANDRDPILVTIGGTTPNNVIHGYHSGDVNLDGSVKYTGTANDRDRILINVGSTTPTNIREGQLP